MAAAVSDDVEAERVARLMITLPTLVNANADLVRRGRFLTCDFELGVGAIVLAVSVENGRIASVVRGPFLLKSWDFAIRMALDTWLKFLTPVPEAGWHDIMALTKRGAARIEGNLQPFMANLQYIKDVLAAPRESAGSKDQLVSSPDFEPIVGRYLNLELSGRPHRVYIEEAGSGVPLVCLHTAGADGRQFRHILNDEAITRHYRVIAFDMPWHGKSLPPAGFETEEYKLTTAGYTQMVLDICDALQLDKPIVMGCSIGGRLVLNLAAEHAKRFRALIGLESADYQQPWYDTEWLHRPDVHGGEVCAALVSGMMAPQSPAANRHETLWMYKSGGPGVFKGDLHFYRVDGDLRAKIDRIDTSVCPLYLLTGEYDFSCTPEDTLRTAARINGVEVTVMKALGHFPMSENPAHFRTYILPILEKIRGRT